MKHFYFVLPAFMLASAATCTAQADADEWRMIGNATVVDGWITPGYVDDQGVQIDPSTCPFEVPIAENVKTPGVYKLINPFGSKNFHLAEFNIDPSDADIVIDARDKTFVLIQGQYCGFTDADASEPSGKYPYYISDMGTYMYNLGQQREVINILKCSSIMTGNTIVVRQPTFGTTADHAISAWDPSYMATITLPDNFQEESANWDALGNAEVLDGWIMPGYQEEDGSVMDNTKYPLTCKAEMNSDNPNLISIVNPFTADDYNLVSYNLSSSNVRIVFDVTDPDFVIVEPQFSGFIARKDNDIMPFFISDASWLLANKRSETKEQITAKGLNCTYKDGVITIPQPLWGNTIDDTGKMWNSKQSTVIRIGTKGVVDIDADSDATVQYFNLQGIEVKNPAPGNFYIRRQGNNVTKVIL